MKLILLFILDHVSELLTTIDACGMVLDLSLNFDLTRMYLDVVCIYVRLLILLSRVDDRKGEFQKAFYVKSIL